MSAALITVVLTAFGIGVLALVDRLNWLVYGIPAAVLVFVLSALIVSFCLDRFVYRRIRGIRQAIQHLEISPNGHGKTRGRVIDELEEKVLRWSEEKGRELASMREMEGFRREFVGNVAHELKTPIFNIQGYLDTLIEGNLEDERVNLQYLRKASSNVDRLMAIVNDLTTINTLESGQRALEITTFDLKQLVLEAFESLEMQAQASQVKLMLKEGSPRALQVKADRNMIRQVLVNLVINSIKYAKDSGGATTVSFAENRDTVRVDVSDTGIGISAADLPRVFERFYRVDTSRSRDRGGTGLGLSIVKHMVEAHGQAVSVKSQVGEGSTFSFTLAKA
jgi:two-component system phosphate regulon sensor histidine kinase PhoR